MLLIGSVVVTRLGKASGPKIHFKGQSGPYLTLVTPGDLIQTLKMIEYVLDRLYIAQEVDKKCSEIILSRPGMVSGPKIPFRGSIRPLFDPGDPWLADTKMENDWKCSGLPILYSGS